MKFRDNGAIGALLDEYQKSIKELKQVILDVSANDLIYLVDKETKDEDCRSIQTILTHVVGSGFTYIIEIRKWLGEKVAYKNIELLPSVDEYFVALDEMFQYALDMFHDYPNIQLEEYHADKKMKVRWGQLYDVEQIMEHAIVHILRHRRQIERFKLQLKTRK